MSALLFLTGPLLIIANVSEPISVDIRVDTHTYKIRTFGYHSNRNVDRKDSPFRNKVHHPSCQAIATLEFTGPDIFRPSTKPDCSLCFSIIYLNRYLRPF